MKSIYGRLQLLPACVSIVVAALAAYTASAAAPAIIRTSRVIQCETCGERRPAVVTGVALTPDGKTIAAATDDHCVTVWDAASGELTSRLDGHADWVRSVVLSPDGNTLASGGGDRALRTWNVLEHRPALNAQANENTVAAVCFHPSGEQLAVVGFTSSLKIVNTSTGQVGQQLVCPCGDTRTVTFSPDGERMAAAGRNGKIRIWSVRNGSQERDIETDGRRIRAMAFSPDGKWLAAAGTSPSIRVFDTATGDVAMTLSTRPAKSYSLVFLDNNRLATGGTDNRIWIWDLTSRQAVTQLVGHTGTVAALASSTDGATLVSGSYDTTIRIWNLPTTTTPTTASRDTTGAAR